MSRNRWRPARTTETWSFKNIINKLVPSLTIYFSPLLLCQNLYTKSMGRCQCWMKHLNIPQNSYWWNILTYTVFVNSFKISYTYFVHLLVCTTSHRRCARVDVKSSTETHQTFVTHHRMPRLLYHSFDSFAMGDGSTSSYVEHQCVSILPLGKTPLVGWTNSRTD